jgi:hypothetical protein
MRFGFHGLEVESLTSGVGREQDLDVAVFGELLGDQTTLASAYTSVDRADGIGLADE